MKRIYALLVMLLVATPAFAASYARVTENSASTIERRHSDQTLYDTTTTTTTLGLPVYTGFATAGTATSDGDWRVCKATESGNVTTIKCGSGAWDDRASLTYA